MIPTENAATGFSVQQRFLRILRPDAATPPQLAEVSNADLPSGSHLHLTYSSSHLLPIEITVPGWNIDDNLIAILPASKKGDVLLDLRPSPSWSPSQKGIILRLYWTGNDAPQVMWAGTEWHGGLLSHTNAVLGHTFTQQHLNSTSMATMEGYRMAGISLSVILGLLLFAVAGIALLRTPKRALSIAMMSAIIMMMLFGVRFTADVAMGTVSDQREWWAQESYSDMGYLYASARILKEESAKEKEMRVGACNRLATALRYFLSPIPVESGAAGFSTATHGVLSNVWDSAQERFSCEGKTRSGVVIKSFSNGEAVVRFTSELP
jgi:hypothetical protein